MNSVSTELYSLNAMPAMQPASDRPGTAPTRLLQTQIDRGFRWLRFTPELETAFHGYLRASSRLSQASLTLIAMLGVLVSALIDTRWLGLPQEALAPTRLIQMGAMLPLGLICIVLCLRYPASRALEISMVLLAVVFSAGLMAQRVVDSRVGLDLPLELVGVVAVATLCLARIRFWTLVPVMLAVLAITIGVELTLVDDVSTPYHLYTTCTLFLVAFFAGYAAEYSIRATWLNASLLQYLARLDRLTGLLNRHALENALETGQSHARRERLDYALALIDIDAFGAYNNHYGHQDGDAALRAVADVLASHARRPCDACGRYGGEEFVILWMGCGVEDARALAGSLRRAVAELDIVHSHSPAEERVTVSVGLCHVEADLAHAHPEAVLRAADRMLYEAKHNGRNRICFTQYQARDNVASTTTRATAADVAATG